MTHINDNPFRDDPFTDDGHLLAPGHPFRKLRGLMVGSVRIFLYRAPHARPLDRFHPRKHVHRFTPSPYRHVFIEPRPHEGQPQYDFYVDTRVPADPCPIWAFADAETLNLDFFRPTLFYWHAGAVPPGYTPPPDHPASPSSSYEISDSKSPAMVPSTGSLVPPSVICNLESAIPPFSQISVLQSSFSPVPSPESPVPPDSDAALLLHHLFSALRGFPTGWIEPPCPWDYSRKITREDEAEV